MNYSNKPLSQTVVQLCFSKGIDHIVISPGSRNAPLTIGFTEYGDFKTYSIVDERCAAFFGLGLAQQLKRPVALVCTSGSALLNYYPAIAEAYYSRIPLVVLSADRPQELIDIGDGQTIRQFEVYKNHILYSGQCKEGKEHQVFNETEINVALNTAIELQGPVHLNLPFSEPLYGKVAAPSVRPQHVPARQLPMAVTDNLAPFIDRWNASNKKLLLIGVMPPHTLAGAILEQWASDPSVLVLTETPSNVHHNKFVGNIDQLITSLSEAEKNDFQPEVLVTMGGMIVSKRIKALLRNFKEIKHWHIGTDKANDTFFHLKHHFKFEVSSFWTSFLPKTKKISSSYQEQWLSVRTSRQARHHAFLETAPYSDLLAFKTIFNALPEGIDLHLANSATVRYAQLFETAPSWFVYCNRGTSGIDGSTSTAIGGSVASARPTVFITGDLSFFYDSNALWNNYVPPSFRLIIINNNGGGIFRILPDAKDAEQFETYFETQHQLSAAPLATLYQWEYRTAADASAVKEELSALFTPTKRPVMLEIYTPATENDKVLQAYFNALY